MNQVLLFNSYGSLDNDGNWNIKLKGWTFSTNTDSTKSRFVRGTLRRMLTPIAGSTEEQKLVFQQRTAGLFSSPLPNQKLKIVITNIRRPLIFTTVEEEDEALEQEFEKLDKQGIIDGNYPTMEVTSDINGLFNAKFKLSISDIKKLGDSTDPQGVRLFAYFSESMDKYTFSFCPLLPPTGISLISDVDDTIKQSSVHKGLIAATKVALFGDMEDVPGMVDCYNLLAAKGFGIHYVSAGPFQLLPLLQSFLETFRFPLGSLVLRNTSLQTSLAYKHEVIMDIIKDFPQRMFILVGDSGEKDIEIYERIRDAAPNQILKVFIRDVGANQSATELEVRARKRVSSTSTKSSSSSLRSWIGMGAVQEEVTYETEIIHKSWKLFKDPTELIIDSDVGQYLRSRIVKPQGSSVVEQIFLDENSTDVISDDSIGDTVTELLNNADELSVSDSIEESTTV